ncbi:MAG: helix-hairpin-helix domain-containing protein [Candidatus Accumulibacter sp.]|nr:helix-hairpin-helix domain-containing protein [Accumulibacter sp.]
MHPNKVVRQRVETLTDLPNIGRAGAADLVRLGIMVPGDLIGKCPFEMYQQLGVLTGKAQDPCVLDVFMSITDFMAGGEARHWWSYTPTRKCTLKRC